MNKTEIIIFDEEDEFNMFFSNQQEFTEKEKVEKMDRVNKGCDLIKKLNLTSNIPEKY